MPLDFDIRTLDVPRLSLLLDVGLMQLDTNQLAARLLREAVITTCSAAIGKWRYAGE